MPGNLLILYYVFFSSLLTGCVQRPGKQIPQSLPDTSYRVMFYNVENLFDVYDDSLTNDDDFTPWGDLHWTKTRYHKKLDNISQVIIAAGQWQMPAMIGLCEVENKSVLEDLIYRTSLSSFSYRFVHKESPDNRGIDVALLYDTKRLRLIESRFFAVSYKEIFSRDILFARFAAGSKSICVIVNHWPSRSEGQLESEVKRLYAATVLKNITDSVLRHDPAASLLIMGDFNDEPHDKSISEILDCGNINERDKKLVNLTQVAKKGKVQGTLKYQGMWNVFDQIIISGNLFNNNDGFSFAENSFTILNNSFLLEKDETFTGYKPFRTYGGYRYLGGFSDHLPVYADMMLRTK